MQQVSSPGPKVEWTEKEVLTRQTLEQALRQRPGDRNVMIGLSSLLSSKFELAEAVELIQRAAVGLSNDPAVATLLRKFAGAKLSLWRAMRFDKEDSLYVNCSDERFDEASEAVECLVQAMAYPENADNPQPLIELANAKLSSGNLVDSLRDFSFLVANHPAYPRLNAAIFRSACLLAHLGDRPQAATYLSYVLDDPPEQSLGYGELEVRALLVCCALDGNTSARAGSGGDGGEDNPASQVGANGGGGPPSPSKSKKESKRASAASAGKDHGGGGPPSALSKLFTVLGDAYEYRSEHLPRGLQRRPPDGVEFADWAEPWMVLAERALSKCDYVVAAEFLRVYLQRPTLLSTGGTVGAGLQSPPVGVVAASGSLSTGTSTSGGGGDDDPFDEDEDGLGEEARVRAEAAERSRALCLLGQCRMLLGDPERALEAVEDAFGFDESAEKPRLHLMEWAEEKWAPRLDASAAAAREQRLAAEEAERRRVRANGCGRFLEKHVKRQRARAVLSHWYGAWVRHFSATTLARVMRGAIARKRARFLDKKRQFLRANIERVVWNINRHLLHHVLSAWREVWWSDNKRRETAARPMVVRFQRRLLSAVVRAWQGRARRQVVGRSAAKKAMKGLRGMAAELLQLSLSGGSGGGGKAQLREGRRPQRPPPLDGVAYTRKEDEAWARMNPPLVFYSDELNLLARFPEFKEHHEQCIEKVLELKAQEDAYVAEANDALRAAAEAAAAEAEAALAAAAAGTLSPQASPSPGKKKKRRKKKSSSSSSSSKVHPGDED